MPPKPFDEQRRKLCQYAGLAVLGAALPACGNGSMGGADAGPLACGPLAGGAGINIADVALNTVASATPFMIEGEPIFICRDAKGLYAVDARCTHVGTNVNLKDPQDATKGFLCPLHAATYDFNGEHPTAPAPSPLKHFLLCATVSGQIVVDTQQEVSPSIRYHV